MLARKKWTRTYSEGMPAHNSNEAQVHSQWKNNIFE